MSSVGGRVSIEVFLVMEKKTVQSKIVTLEKLPVWYRRYGNSRIKTGYFYYTNATYLGCLQKLVKFNNDSISIYMNLVCGLISGVMLLFYTDVRLIPSHLSLIHI